jgi:hypothetical protein
LKSIKIKLRKIGLNLQHLHLISPNSPKVSALANPTKIKITTPQQTPANSFKTLKRNPMDSSHNQVALAKQCQLNGSIKKNPLPS